MRCPRCGANLTLKVTSLSKPALLAAIVLMVIDLVVIALVGPEKMSYTFIYVLGSVAIYIVAFLLLLRKMNLAKEAS